MPNLFLAEIGSISAFGNNPCHLATISPRVFLVCLVYLVHQQQHGNGHLPHLVQKVLVLLGVFHHVSDIEQDIGIGQGALREGEHHLLHLVVGLQHARRIRKHNLHVVGVDYAHDAVARGLRLEGGNADALAHQLVHERALAHIGITHNVYESCFVHL